MQIRSRTENNRSILYSDFRTKRNGDYNRVYCLSSPTNLVTPIDVYGQTLSFCWVLQAVMAKISDWPPVMSAIYTDMLTRDSTDCLCSSLPLLCAK